MQEKNEIGLQKNSHQIKYGYSRWAIKRINHTGPKMIMAEMPELTSLCYNDYMTILKMTAVGKLDHIRTFSPAKTAGVKIVSLVNFVIRPW